MRCTLCVLKFPFASRNVHPCDDNHTSRARSVKTVQGCTSCHHKKGTKQRIRNVIDTQAKRSRLAIRLKSSTRYAMFLRRSRYKELCSRGQEHPCITSRTLNHRRKTRLWLGNGCGPPVRLYGTVIEPDLYPVLGKALQTRKRKRTEHNQANFNCTKAKRTEKR